MTIMSNLLASIVGIAAVLPSGVYGATEAIIRVDFAQPAPTHLLVGFLHGVTESAPSTELIQPLNIQYWRTALFESLDGTRMTPDAYARLKMAAPQAKIQYVISDEWGYACCRATVRWPFDNYALWEAFVAASVRAKQQAKDTIAYWEVWNEPNIPFFWAGSMDQFFETYARTYRVLRQQLGPDAPIAGPSFYYYDRDLIKRFLDYCLANQLEVNILSWHENDHVAIPGIAANINEARAQFLQSEKYRALRIREIHIDEYGGPKTKHSPAAMLGYLYYLEAAQADVAAKSCWKDSKRRNECFNGSLDGLIDVDTMSPRSVWWIYKLYADAVSSRVKSVTSDPAIIALGSRTSATSKHAQILAGNFVGSSTLTSRPVNIVLENLDTLPFLSKSTVVVVTIKRLLPTGEQPSSGPEVVQELVMPLSGEVHIPIPRFGGGEVYVLDVAAESPLSRHRVVPRKARTGGRPN